MSECLAKAPAHPVPAGSPPARQGPPHDLLPFVRGLSSRLIEELRLQPDDLLADLHCGTGLFSCGILEQVQLRSQLVAVDPSPDALAQIPIRDELRTVTMDALSFAAFPVRYDKILIKDAIHSIEDRPRLLASLRDRLCASGILLLANTAPRRDRSLFESASQRLEAQHVQSDMLAGELRRAGLQVRRSSYEHCTRIPLDRYCSLVEGRYLPVLAAFSDRELRSGVSEIRRNHAGRNVVEYTDRVELLAGSRGDRPALDA